MVKKIKTPMLGLFEQHSILIGSYQEQSYGVLVVLLLLRIFGAFSVACFGIAQKIGMQDFDVENVVNINHSESG